MTEQEISKLRGFLGLCQRAGQVILGQDACVDAVRRETAAIVLLDESSTDVSKKRFRNACYSHHVPLYGVPRGLVAGALGRDGRMAAVIRQGTMARKLQELLPKEIMMTETSNHDHADNAGVQA